ncbi:nucleotide exchange factor GrpE [Nocardioides sediminis]|uniref:nucleotide exchange factor GrpE n=1 Tax=Nocardioides sediminis TaxID=433648 RepID=UPI001F2B3252|nr:nucleotide exchange factor GrpE [Nocardioides sediminis]
MTSSHDSFGDAAGEMANETEVEVTPQGDTSASAGTPGPTGAAGDTAEPTAAPVDEQPGGEQPVGEQSVGEQPVGGTPVQDEDTEVDELAAMKGSLADLTNDLQRLSAEYANYRRRVDRDRQLVADNAAYKALAPVIEVLDTIDRAREHGELDGGFKAVADQLERAVASSGLTRFGEPGDAFDPTRHEALSHLGEDAEVSVTTVKHVAKGGYTIGDRVVRAAQVLVVDPAAPNG